MFIFLNNLRSAWRKRIVVAQSSRSGQVAVIMIVIIAIGLVLFAASINLTMMSQAKTITMKAASNSAANMASFIASYGQEEFVQTLGRRQQYCKSSGGGLMSLVTIIIMIIIYIYAPELAPMLGTSTGALQGAAVVGAVMEGASMLIAASIDPGISDMWNRMQDANLTVTGQAVEHGLQAGLQSAVTDSGNIPDLYDMDGDGLFGYAAGANPLTDPPNDTISRFSLYNTKRFLSLTGPDTHAVSDFVNALHELVVAGTDNWGLWDPVLYPDYKTHAGLNGDGNSPNAGNLCFLAFNDGRRPAECDYCCTNWGAGDTIPPECDPASGTPQVGVRATCAGRTPFRNGGNVYQFVYDFSYEDATNGFMSFREQLGRDDEHHLYHAQSANPNWHPDPVNGLESINGGAGDIGFYLKDTVGYYTSPYFTPATPDIWVNPLPPNGPGIAPFKKPSLFPFLYKMSDWGAKLADLTYVNYECHWCDANSGFACPANMAVDYPEIPRLVLPFNPALVPYNNAQGWCVNKANSGLPNDPPLLADIVPGLTKSVAPGSPGLLVPDDQCAINPAPAPLSDLDQYVNGWKRGADRYCSSTAGVMYSVDCPKHGVAAPPSATANPQCGQPGAAAANSWPDDMIDEIIYGLPVLFDQDRSFWQATHGGGGLVSLAKSLADWYGIVSSGQPYTGGISDWIEPPCPDINNCPGSFTKLARPGTLWVWRAELKFINQQIQDWMVPPASSPTYSGTTAFGGGAAWCLPAPVDPFPGISRNQSLNIPQTEKDTFDVNGNGVRGDVADVVACLYWNAQNTVVYPPGAGIASATGNADKFQACHDHCSSATCENVLPRSLTPRFYDPVLMPQFADYPGATNAFLTCLGSPTLAACTANCNDTALPQGSPFLGMPIFNQPTWVSSINDIDSWCAGPNAGNVLNNACNGAKMPGGETKLTCAVNKDFCRCSWGNDCSAIATGANECVSYCATNPAWCDTNFRDKVADQIPISKGSCCITNVPPGNVCDPKYANFYTIIQESATEAQIQVRKLKKRADFLQGRLDEAMALSYDNNNPRIKDVRYPGLPDGILTTAIKKLTAFLDNDTPNNFDDSPAEKFIQARMNTITQITGDLPSFVVYVWQDQDAVKLNPAGQPRWGTGQGYWHAVKVEVRIPRRCSGNCLATDWPKVDSTTSGGGFLQKTKVCYTLINLNGMTKTRVIRYDQDKDLRGLIFPNNGQSIWDARMTHPSTGRADATGLRATCDSLIDPDLKNWLNNGADVRSHVGAAFMMNKVPNLNNAGDPYTQCWLKVHTDLLAHGIQSEACAQYYFHEPEGFRIRFVPCDSW